MIKTDTLDLKIFVTSILLLELLDETVGQSKFKHKLRYHINGTTAQLEHILSVPIKDLELSHLLTDAVEVLDEVLNDKLNLKE